MQESIKRINNQQYTNEKGNLIFSTNKLEIVVQKDSVYEGHVEVSCQDGNVFKGYVYSSDYRMQCKDKVIRGGQAMLHYQFDASGMDIGETAKGEISVVTSFGQFFLPFQVEVPKMSIQSSMGSVKNLFHFVNLAKGNWKEAVHVFYSDSFQYILNGADRHYLPAYFGLSKYKYNEQNMDEFLILTKKKQRVHYSLVEEEIVFDNFLFRKKGEACVERDGWGYTRLELSAIGDFIVLLKEELVSEDFAGNRCMVPFEIREEALHEGNNYGKILCKSLHETLEISIKIVAGKRISKVHECEREKRGLILQMMDTYLQYRTDKMEQEIWISESEKIVEQMVKLHTGSILARLYQADILLKKDCANEAKWILTHVGNMFENGMGTDMEYAYYLFLTCEYGQDVHKEEVLSELKKIRDANKSNFQIYYLLLQLCKEQQKDKADIYQEMEELFLRGANSPIMYHEAYCFLKEHPERFNKLGAFELQSLRLASKYQVLTEEMAVRMANLALRSKENYRVILSILEEGYRSFKNDEILRAICSLLIQNTCTNNQYFPYFELAVEKNLRITRLYEYYMFSIDMSKKIKLPRTVFLFFSYECHLDYERKAYLFSCACRQQKELGELFDTYKEQILDFIKEQILKLHINTELAFLYENYLGELSFDEELANHFVQMVFKYKIPVDKEGVRSIVVIHEQLKEERIYPVVDKQAYVSVYTQEFCILTEDEKNNRSVISNQLHLEPVLLYKKLLYLLEHFTIQHLGFFLYLCEDKKDYTVVNESNMDVFAALLLSDKVTDVYKQGISRRLLKYYFDHDYMSQLKEMIGTIRFSNIHADDQDDILVYMLSLGMHDEAYQFVLEFGIENITAKTLSKICVSQLEKNQSKRNGTLLWLCFEVFKKGKVWDNILLYLVDYFDGTLKQMKDIWVVAREKEMDTVKLERRILTQYLFCGGYLSKKDDIFYSYGERIEGVDELMHAYVAKACYDYFVKEHLVDEKLFAAILQFVHTKEPLPVVCKLAFVKYFSQIKKRNEKISLEEQHVIIEFLDELIQSKYFFSFFFAFKEWVPLMLTCADRTYVEFRTEPGCKVTIHYLIAMDGKNICDYKKIPMREMYDGYYSTSFCLFFSQQLQYYITKEMEGEESLVESGKVEKLDAVDIQKETRFSLLNDILVSTALQDRDTTMQLMKEYDEKVFTTETILKLM